MLKCLNSSLSDEGKTNPAHTKSSLMTLISSAMQVFGNEGAVKWILY